MKKYIDITKAVRQDIRKAFKVTEQMVSYALRFDPTNGMSDTAKRIRSYALQKGGVVMVVGKEVETIHDADGYMRQYFPNGAVIELDKSTGNATLTYRGEMLISFDNIKVRELSSLQIVAARWMPRDTEKMKEPGFAERMKRGVLMTWGRLDIVKHEKIKNP